MLTTMLVPLDGSKLAERALPYAEKIARATSAEISLVHVTSGVQTPHRPQVELDTVTRLEHVAEYLRNHGRKAAAQTLHGDVANAIVEAARTAHADLIVMSTHGRGGLGRWLFGSVADDVLRRAEIPVMLISATCDRSWPTDRPLKLLIPLDGSTTSEAALAPARELGQALGADLLLMRSVEPAAVPRLVFDPEEIRLRLTAPSQRVEQARDYLDEMASQVQVDFRSIDVLADVGDPAPSIAALARQEQADLIVMATHGRTGLAGLTLGSVAHGTVHRAHVPVLLVRPAALRQEGVAPRPSSAGAGQRVAV